MLDCGEACLIPALGRQRQVDFCEFEASLVYKVSFMIGFKDVQRNPVLKNQKTNKPEMKQNTILAFFAS